MLMTAFDRSFACPAVTVTIIVIFCRREEEEEEEFIYHKYTYTSNFRR